MKSGSWSSRGRKSNAFRLRLRLGFPFVYAVANLDTLKNLYLHFRAEEFPKVHHSSRPPSSLPFRLADLGISA